MCIAYGGGSGDEGPGVTLDLAVAIESPMRRAFWVEPPRFEDVDLSRFEPDARERHNVFEDFAALRHLDWPRMREHICQMLSSEANPTLSELIERYPVTSGIVEVVGYLQIASEDGHLVDPGSKETIVISARESDQRHYLVTIPRVTFLPPRRNGHAR